MLVWLTSINNTVTIKMTREAKKDPHLGPPVFWTLIRIFKMSAGPQDHLE